MKVVLYIILGLVTFVGGFFAWFFIFFLKVPELEITQDMSESQKIEVIDNWFITLQEQNKFNGVVLFSKEGNSLLSKGYGFTNHKKETYLTEHSSLRLASVSKQFTAAGILLLKEKGAIDYDDLVIKYLKEFPYKNVSIRHLLNQTSGIPDSYMELANTHKEDIPILTNEIAVDLIIKEKRAAKYSPIEKFQYSNTNYILLARLIEIISGRSFEAFMSEELFKPLGMMNTRVWNLKSKESSFQNKADDFDNNQKIASSIQPTFIDGVAGDGAVFSSADDLLIWDAFWYKNSLLSTSTLEEAFKKPMLNNGALSDYGFGWMITDNGMWHNGAWLGARTIIIRNTEKKTCLALLDNSTNVFFDKIVEELKKVSKYSKS